jgi:hypothetical protein
MALEKALDLTRDYFVVVITDTEEDGQLKTGPCVCVAGRDPKIECTPFILFELPLFVTGSVNGINDVSPFCCKVQIDQS